MNDITRAILTDRAKYPDDMEITLIGGEKITVKQFREDLIPKVDMTRATEAGARKQRELEGALQGVQGQLTAAQTQLDQEIAARRALEARPGPGATRTEGPTDEELLADPVIGRLVKDIREAKTLMTEIREEQKTHADRLKRHEDTWIANAFDTQLRNIAAYHNGRFNKDGQTPFDREAFVKYATERGVVDLDVAYRSYSLDHAIKAAADEAEARGVERGKAEARVPNIPNGRRSTPPRDPGLPASLDELKDETVLADPDIQAALRGEEAA